LIALDKWNAIVYIGKALPQAAPPNWLIDKETREWAV
jgi:hypothetical protein